jgi:hypothetical protein
MHKHEGDAIMSEKQTPIKSKLFKLKEWLTVTETAQHLSNIFGETVSEADVLRLALDGHLKLSVNFVNYTKAKRGKVVPYEDAEWSEWPPELVDTIPNLPDEAKGKPARVLKSLNIDDERYLNLDEKVTTLKGVWDLPMIGNERMDIEHEYQGLTGGPRVTLGTIGGTFVEEKDNLICQLQESFDNNEYQCGSIAQLEEIKKNIASNNMNEKEAKERLNQHKKNREKYLDKRKKKNPEDDYYPAGGLPHDSVLVVRTNSLTDLQKRLSSEESAKEKPLGIRAETTYLNIIGALLEVISGESPDMSKHPDFSSEAKLIEHFSNFNISGLSKTTLESKFAKAKRSIISNS